MLKVSQEKTELFLGPSFKAMITFVKQCANPDDAKSLVPKLEEFNARRRDTYVNALKPTGPFNVLTHNDVWTSNILYR